jgi:predicted permease
MIQQLAGILLPVFIVTGIGFAWSKFKMPLERDSVARLVMNIATPCLILDSVSKLTLPVADFFMMLLSGLALIMGSALCGVVVLRLGRLPTHSFLPALTFGNAGNMGLPLCLFAFGEVGLGLGAAVFLVAVVTQFTLAPALQDRAPPLLALAKTPAVYASAVGVWLLSTGAQLPGWLDTTVGLLADIAIPLSLLMLGFCLAELRVKRVRQALGLGLARLTIGIVVAVIVAEALKLTGVARGVLILHGGMPTAVFAYLLSARYQRDPEDVAGVVLVSTLVSVVSLPFLVSYVLWTSQ